MAKKITQEEYMARLVKCAGDIGGVLTVYDTAIATEVLLNLWVAGARALNFSDDSIREHLEIALAARVATVEARRVS
jgi:hypothetical protein